jgi:MFS family permease
VLGGPLDAAVNVAFPAITAAFELELQAIQWVVIAYMLTYSSLILVSGRLGDLYGHRRIFRAGVAVSAVAFLGCALAPGYGWLLAARALQGAGMALTIGCAPALALSVYPESERTRTLARFSAVFAFGLALGPLAGGALVELFGWRAVFWSRVPLMLAALLLLARVPSAPLSAARRPFNAPILPPRLFADTRFALVNLCSVAVNLAGFAAFLLGPYWFVRISGLSVLSGGVLLAFAPAGALIGAAIAAPLVQRVGAYRAASASATVVVAGVALAAYWTPATGFAAMAAVLLLQGMGIGTFQVAYSDIVIDTLPPQDRGVAGSLANLTRTLGVVGGAALLSALHRAASLDALAAGADPDAAFVAGFRYAVTWAACGLALFVAAMLLRARQAAA